MTDKSTGRAADGAAPPQDFEDKASDNSSPRNPSNQDKLDFSILKGSQAPNQPYEHFQIEKTENQRASGSLQNCMRQSIDSQFSQGFSSNTFLFKNFSKLTQRSQDNNGPTYSTKSPVVAYRNSVANHSMRQSMPYGLPPRNTVGTRPRFSNGTAP